VNDADARELAFRLYLRNVETAKIAQALAREHGYKVETAEVERWVAERLEGQDPQRAKTVSAITEANRELWAAAASPGVAPAAKAGYLQAIARNEERLLRIAGPDAERTGPARYVAVARQGRCGARGRGKDAGRFCDEPPTAGRRRCRIHGGASPTGAAHPRTKHGLYANGSASDIFAAPFGDEERRLIDRWRREPEEALRLQLAEGALMQRRAMRASAVELYTRLGTMIATTARALVSLREVPPPEHGLPKLIEVYEGRTPEDFEHDLELIRRDAQVAA
jgi:hypothetical protein